MKRDKGSSLRIWRVLVPLTFSLTTVLLLWRHQYPLSPDAASSLLWLSRLDPLMLLAEWRAAGSLPGWFWLPLGVVVLTFLFGRIFCGWICPLGGMLAQIPIRYNGLKILEGLHKSRYIWLVFLLILLTGSHWPLFLTPFHLLTEELTRLWQGKIPWLLASMILLGVLFPPRFWCIYICPTGLILAAVSRLRSFRLRIGELCMDCGVCGEVCPTKAAHVEEGKMTEDCMLCGRCWQACPVEAIKWRNPGSVPPSGLDVSPTTLSRRQLFKSGLVLMVGGFGWKHLEPAAAAGVIRPPGARPEEEFLARCSRCGRCVKVCPTECLFPMPLEAGFTAFLTPRIIPRQAKCELCLSCQEVCPTGAIDRVPLKQVKMGIAELKQSRCLVWAEQKLCLLCREQCPVHAIEVDEENRPYVSNNVCVGCGACENGCPLKESAIIVRPIEK